MSIWNACHELPVHTHFVSLWSNNRYCTVWLLTWSPSSVSPSIPALISFVINFKKAKNKYSSWYGIHKGNFLQLNTTINKCSYQGIVWQHQHDTCTKIWKKHCLNAASKWTKYDGVFSRYYRYTYMLNVHYCKLKSCW